MSENKNKTPKALKSGNGSNFVIPFAIVLIGSLIIFGVTKMLQNDRTYRDLVQDLQSKTFGNRWIAAFELSKVISSKKVPDDDIPWLIENLDDLYDSAVDNRTKNFIIVALGSLGDTKGVKTIERGLSEEDPATRFHAVVALASIKDGSSINFELLVNLLDSNDEGLKQAAILTLATHRYDKARNKLVYLLKDNSRSIRFAAATGLIYFREVEAVPTVKEILSIDRDKYIKVYSPEKIFGLKINVLNALKKTKWTKFNPTLLHMLDSEKDLKIISAVRDVLSEIGGK